MTPEERIAALEAQNEALRAKVRFAVQQAKSAMDLWADTAGKLDAAEAELARRDAAERNHTAAKLGAAKDMREGRG